MRKPKILVLDDERAITEMLCETLEDDFDLVCLTSADDALERLGWPDPFDAVITDINLGSKVDGLEIAEKAREMNPDATIIYTSGAAAQRVAYEGIRGAAFIPKPFTGAEIANALLWMLNESKPQAA